jgi:uncharacterized protein
MVRRLLCVVLLFVPLAAVAAAALTLDAARQQGLVGEDSTGFIGAVSPNPSKEVQALVDDINAKRRAAYEKVARETSTPSDPVTAEDVGRLGAGKIFDRAPPGTYIRLPEQGWQRKP